MRNNSEDTPLLHIVCSVLIMVWVLYEISSVINEERRKTESVEILRVL